MSNTTPWTWGSYTAPTMTPTFGFGANGGGHGFYRPSNSQLPTGAALDAYIMPNGANSTPDQVTNRTVKYDGGLTREMLGNTTGFLNDQLGKGFGGINDMLNNFGGLGGLGGMQGGSPVYRPGGAPVGQGATNGQPLPWGVSNPFNQTF
jgi:hypothetical protein